jgi:hypothetical protein
MSGHGDLREHDARGDDTGEPRAIRQSLSLDKHEIAVFALASIGLTARALSPYAGGVTVQALELAALAWGLAHPGFVAGHARMLLARPRH